MVNNETKICKKCGRTLPLDQFRICTGCKGYTYRRGTCRACEAEYDRELAQRKNRVTVKEKDENQLFYKRKYKQIAPERILDLTVTGIEPMAADEIFVRLMEYKDSWISNYGRLIRLTYGKYILLKGADNGDIYYNIQQEVWTGEKLEYKRSSLYAAKAVVATFLVNPDCQTNRFIWHEGQDKQDNYYKHLYPLNQDQYYAVRHYYEQHGEAPEEVIVQIMNDIQYLPDDWSIAEMQPIMAGVGYHGMQGVSTRSIAYKTWKNMMQRCYNDGVHERLPQYKDCSVCDEWHNFCNFEKWYKEHYFCAGYQLDKDITIKGNKLYSPETCAFVPQSINTLFGSGKVDTGNLPIGVYWDSSNAKYRANVSIGGESKKLSYWSTPEEAFAEYKLAKEKIIRSMAEKYRDTIPDKVYRSMMDWKIEITD